MKEERNDYTEDNLVELVDDEGNSYLYEHLMTIEYKGKWYCALTQVKDAEEVPEDGDEEDAEEVAIYRLEGDEEDEQLVQIEDENELDEVFAEFCAQYEDFADADEAEKLDR